ncbi:hypothetical protein BS78_01G016600 [Paspalum vaginatum]|nr:hypothetical protein BS78_01G016600 [Paspalum vaginatum]KAJ1292778.1 hypothetical protein BS78_01G016600 [Paspalum vaginatum]
MLMPPVRNTEQKATFRRHSIKGNMMMEQELNHTGLLPVDMLTQILCRLKPRDLAVSRGVCIEWKDIIDDCCLLCIEDLLPHSIAAAYMT